MLHCFPIQHMICFKLGLLCTLCSQPQFLKSILISRTCCYGDRASHCLSLVVPKYRTFLVKEFLSDAEPKIWNSLQASACSALFNFLYCFGLNLILAFSTDLSTTVCLCVSVD